MKNCKKVIENTLSDIHANVLRSIHLPVAHNKITFKLHRYRVTFIDLALKMSLRTAIIKTVIK